MSSSLLLQKCPGCLVRLTWIVFVMGGRSAAVLLGVASRTGSILLAAFLYNFFFFSKAMGSSMVDGNAGGKTL